MEMTVPNFTYTFEIQKELDFLMKCFLLLALIALFFKAYAVEADIRLLAFYLHLLDQDPEGVRFVWDELARTRPEDFPRRVASFIRLSQWNSKKRV